MTFGASRKSRMSLPADAVASERWWRGLRWDNGLLLRLLMLLMWSQATAASDWTVEALMGLLKEHRLLSVSFQETTYSSLLTEPVTVTGVLKFVPPDRMEKTITSPFNERYMVEGDRVTFESERQAATRTISLEDYPGLRSVVEAFRAGLTGDVLTLRNIYEVTMQGTRSKWTLLLRPREPLGKSLVDYILLSGSEGRVGTIAIRSPDGDRSVTTLLAGAAR
jgi:outer membrane lipoprotein-sorting protein